ncbi:MAG: thiamine diphosphokinase [Coriobacteriia bacterium]|nr:thiamine diphosphokinase [Coriobacteriia bacterium]
MKSALLIGAAPIARIDSYRAALMSCELFVAIDGGLEIFRELGVRPQILIGDLDSVDRESLDWVQHSDTEVIPLPVAKDVSDLDAALELARDRRWGPLTVGGILGGRPDHTLAAMGSLARSSALDIRFIGDTEDGFVLDETHHPSLSLEDIGLHVSLIAPLGTAVVTLEGFRFPLREGALQTLTSLGLSNVSTAVGATITVHTGRILVFVSSAINTERRGLPTSA